jgi:hypothetical protein
MKEQRVLVWKSCTFKLYDETVCIKLIWFTFRTLSTILKQLGKPNKILNKNCNKSESGALKIWRKSVDKCIVIIGLILPFYKCELQGEKSN